MPWSVETKLPSEAYWPAEAPTCHDASTAATPARTCPACAAAGASRATTATAAHASFPPPIATPNVPCIGRPRRIPLAHGRDRLQARRGARRRRRRARDLLAVVAAAGRARRDRSVARGVGAQRPLRVDGRAPGRARLHDLRG